MNMKTFHIFFSPVTVPPDHRILVRWLPKACAMGLFIFAFLLAVPLCGWAAQSENSIASESRPDAEKPQSKKHTDADKPIARVDGELVLVRDVLRRLSAQHPQIHHERPEKGQWQEWVREALEGEILDRLLLQQATADGVDVAEDVIQASVARSKELMGEEAYSEMLKKRGDSEEEYRQFLSDRMRIENYKANLLKGIEVQEEEISDYYEQNREAFRLPERFQLQFMIVEDQGVADEVMKRLMAGERFEAVANTATLTFHSGADGKRRWMSLQSVPEDLQAHLQGAEEGETLGPFPGQDGFYVAQFLGKKPAENMDLPAASPYIRTKLLAEKRTQRLVRWFEAEKKNGSIAYLSH